MSYLNLINTLFNLSNSFLAPVFPGSRVGDPKRPASARPGSRRKSGGWAACASLMLALSFNATAAEPADGLYFECPKAGQTKARHQLLRYLQAQAIPAGWLTIAQNPKGLHVQLKPAMRAARTLEISRDPRFDVRADLVELLDPRRAPKQVPTVSRKEILLALMYPGRSTVYSGPDCGIEALQDDVGVRQTTVAWAQNVSFGWPDGGPAKWNAQYWDRGTPKFGVDLHEALTDALINSSDYSVGCYAAAKIILAAAQLDYYHRIKGSVRQARAVQDALLVDGEPLVDIEPGRAWYFEGDYDPADARIAGKIIDVREGVAPHHFVPGDWIYLLNPDPVSYAKTGYEGSNAIYLGMNNFSDYYNDHEHSFRFEQKVHEVYQWRHGVFSRSRDADKVVPITPAMMKDLVQSPERGGLLVAHRLVPRSPAFQPAMQLSDMSKKSATP